MFLFKIIAFSSVLSTLALPFPLSHNQPRAIAINSDPVKEVGINAFGRAIAAIAEDPIPAVTSIDHVHIDAIARAIAAISDKSSSTVQPTKRAIAISPSDKPIHPDAIARAIAAIAVTSDDPSKSQTLGIDAIARAIAIKPSKPTGIHLDAIARYEQEERAIAAIAVITTTASSTEPKKTGWNVNAIAK
ncbi:uncharacterized protein IL334_003440 [Kwoniella shivajii]|uniref:Uncharacterized protein n=1 Tax=Kwoniella shivajii TaxID=564305 RepID=A0ABZ1CXX4_9TREE|nr:hypothetical protein IL334_003440 [Kwoniella shivajii]